MRMLLFSALFGSWLSGMAQPAGYGVFNRAFTIDANGVAHMNEAPGDGVAWINGQVFTEGTIEVDIRGKDVFQRSFVGIAYHGIDDSTFEAVYFRPFNFRSPDPARLLHAVQYEAPPVYDWSKLRQEHPDFYEKPVTPAPDPNEWFHARIVVGSDSVRVFVNGAAVAALRVAPIVHRAGRKIGYWVGNGSSGDWKDLHITSKK
jgi:Domain of Unknown Function (DUF1080)